MIERPEIEVYEPLDFLEVLSEKDMEIQRLRARLSEIEGGPVANPDRPIVSEGIVPYWDTPDGWTIATIKYDVVPGYDFEAACEGLTPEAIRQEILIDWSATRGKRVYPEYGKIHEAAHPLVYDPRRPLYCGWDFGSHDGGTPAFVPTQINTFGQLLVFPPIAPLEDESIGTYAFGQVVADHIQREYAGKVGKKWRDIPMLHFGDPNGNQRPPRTGDSKREMVTHFQILEHGMKVPLGTDESGNSQFKRKPGFGFKIQPGPVNISDRLEAVRARLNLLLPGALPALVVDPRAIVIKDGFSGGYHHKKKADGSYEEFPEKNWFCVDEETEALSPKGWRKRSELKPLDEIYCYSPKSGGLHLGMVTKINHFPGEVPVLHYTNASLDMMVTAAHRCLTSRRVCSTRGERYGAVELVEAQDLNSSHHLLAHATVGSPGHCWSDNLVRLCGWVMADGTYRKDGSVLIYQSETANPSYCADLDALYDWVPSKKSKPKAGPGMRCWRFMGETAKIIRGLMPEKFPSFGFIQQMDGNQMRLFLYEAIRGDGCGWGRGKYGPMPAPIAFDTPADFHIRPGTVRFYQKPERREMMDSLQMMATLAGLSSSLKEYRGKMPRLSLSITRHRKRGITVGSLKREAATTDGVWCPTTTGGTWIARRNGRTFITGNSHSFDALAYIVSRLFVRLEEEDDAPVRPGSRFRCQASARMG